MRRQLAVLGILLSMLLVIAKPPSSKFAPFLPIRTAILSKAPEQPH
jgi:hypothetical protein